MNTYYKLFKQSIKIGKNEIIELKRTLKTSQNKEIRKFYIKQLENALKLNKNFIQILIKNRQLKSYEFYSANLSKLIPKIDEEEHFKWWFEFFKWKTSENLQLQNPFMLENVKIISKDNSDINPNHSAIYTTFQYGSSQSIIGYLISNNVNLVLLVDQKSYDNKAIFEQYIDKTITFLGKDVSYDILNVESSNTILKLISYIKRGYSVFAYPDGNDGIGGVFNKKAQLLKIKFFSGEIFVRVGLAHLSFATKTPIIPIISSYEENLFPRISVYPDISPKDIKDRDDYSTKTTKKLWQILENHINSYPAQWSGWDYVHKYFDFENMQRNNNSIMNNEVLETNNKIKLNRKKYRIFKIDDQAYLFNRILYKTYPIDMELFDILSTQKGYTKDQILKKSIKIQLLNELIENGVFTFI